MGRSTSICMWSWCCCKYTVACASFGARTEQSGAEAGTMASRKQENTGARCSHRMFTEKKGEGRSSDF
jgi:hypothetical protein